MKEFKYLSGIKGPSDVKKLDYEQLEELAEEVRAELIETVSKNGGHLASNLGVVELSIALHKVFDSPRDKIVWDVGHQAYVHKLLTGRLEDFTTLRREGGLSGFTRPDESEHDSFYSGHSSTAVSAALGIAEANKLKGNKRYAVAVVGDGAFTGGMVYEAMNNAGRSNTRLIVILNNNEMSISKNVGALAKYFAVVRSRPAYFRIKARTETAINKIPFVGEKLSMSIFKLKTKIKNMIYSSTMFEDFGFRYMGPIDGHNIKQLCDALRGAKAANFPILLHINTTKGKGYDYAERDPSTFHGISQFDINSGEPITAGLSYSKAFGKFMCEMASKDRRICAVTAAMSIGTGLDEFAETFPHRFFDVGIAEQHAVTFCSGLAKGGMMPVFAVYSTFLQRSYDQLIHDGALQGLHYIIAVDRAGFVGPDGETHNGLFDVPFLNTIPDITVYSPSSYADMQNCFYKAFYHDTGLVVVRYHSGAQIPLPDDFEQGYGNYESYGDSQASTALISYGREFALACDASSTLKKRGISVEVIKLNRIKPIDPTVIELLLKKKNVFFFEEGEKTGSVAEVLGRQLVEAGYEGEYFIRAVEDKFVPHASVSAQLKSSLLDSDNIVAFVTEVINGRQDKT